MISHIIDSDNSVLQVLAPYILLFSFGYVYILLAVDYVSKWVEAKPTRTNDAKVVDKIELIAYGLF